MVKVGRRADEAGNSDSFGHLLNEFVDSPLVLDHHNGRKRA